MDVSLTVNGRETTLSVEPRQLLGQVLRDDCGIDVRLDCETSTCGSCTVLLDGDPVKSCAVLAPMASGAMVTTAAGLPRHDVVGRAVAALEDRSVLPCGECRPAMQVVVASLLQSAARCSTDDVARAMSGTVCRCTGYRSVVDAVVNAADDRSPG
jgi:aerobic carbon-monoxide dehydrogenase small subunit